MNNRVSAIVSSVGLIALTTVVFWSATIISPESILRRFIQHGKTFRYDLVTPSRSEAINQILTRVTATIGQSGELEIIRQDRRQGFILLVSRVKTDEGVPVDYSWVLAETRQGWRIDGERTVAAWATQQANNGSQ